MRVISVMSRYTCSGVAAISMLAVPRFAVGIPGTSGPPREATLAADRILARGWPAGRDDESAVGQAAPQRHGTSPQMHPERLSVSMTRSTKATNWTSYSFENMSITCEPPYGIEP